MGLQLKLEHVLSAGHDKQLPAPLVPSWNMTNDMKHIFSLLQ